MHRHTPNSAASSLQSRASMFVLFCFENDDNLSKKNRQDLDLAFDSETWVFVSCNIKGSDCLDRQ